jgi:branched-chain amino acid transport system permease protein
MGFLIGFKALTAAIVGGIGSIRGAVLGGALIAVLETFWSGYLGGNYREVAVFTVLALVLVFRPAGLLGRDPDVYYQDAR